MPEQNGHISNGNGSPTVPMLQPSPNLAPLPDDQDGEPLGKALAYRWRSMLIVFGLLASTSATAIWFFVPPKYQVAATVKMAPVLRPILFNDQDTDISRWYSTYVATEIRAMTSGAVLAETLQLPEIRDLPLVRNAAAPVVELGSRISAEQVQATEMVQLSMTGIEAADMVRVVNAMVQVYLRRHKSQKLERDEAILSSLRSEKRQLEVDIRAKEAGLRLSVGTLGIAGAEDSGALLDDWLTEVQSLLTQSRKERALAIAKITALDTAPDSPNAAIVEPAGLHQDLTHDAELEQLRVERRSLGMSKLSDDQFGRGEQHPQVQGREKKLANIAHRMAERTAELWASAVAAERTLLTSTIRDAEVTIKLFQEELAKLEKKREVTANRQFDLDSLHHERQRLELALDQVRQKIYSVEVEQNRSERVTIDSLAVAPSAPNIDKRLKYSAAAVFMSLLISAAFALLRHRMDHSLLEPEEVGTVLGIPVLGSVAYVSKKLPQGATTNQRMLQPIRGISAALTASDRNTETRSRLIAGPTRNTGKSTLAINLARTLAGTGRRVLLVDADNHGRGVSRELNLNDRPGVCEILLGKISGEKAVCRDDASNLRVLPAGKLDEQFGEILCHADGQARLIAAFEAYDEIIIDSPPLLASSDAVVLATLVHETVLVLRAGHSTREDAKQAQVNLASVGAKVVGVVLNAVNPRTSSYGYRYDYTYDHADA